MNTRGGPSGERLGSSRGRARMLLVGGRRTAGRLDLRSCASPCRFGATARGRMVDAGKKPGDAVCKDVDLIESSTRHRPYADRLPLLLAHSVPRRDQHDRLCVEVWMDADLGELGDWLRPSDNDDVNGEPLRVGGPAAAADDDSRNHELERTLQPFVGS